MERNIVGGKIEEFSMNFFCLEQKVALVTGGNSGLGRAFSLALAKAGANIFAITIMKDNGVTKSIIENEGVQYREFVADITQSGVCKQIVEKCITEYGRIDILMNNAGICINEPDVTHFTRAEWEKWWLLI